MVMLRQEPYLWVHLAGLAALPLTTSLCLAGLASAEPAWPLWLEFGGVASLAIVPILLMQWRRPFYIFSLGMFALHPSMLSETQRQLLALFRAPTVRWLTLLGALLSTLALWWLYQLAPLMMQSETMDQAPVSARLGGLFLATLSFLASNLFLQVPLSVIPALLADDATVREIEPLSPQQIATGFTLVGAQVPKLLPSFAAAVPSGVGAKPGKAKPERVKRDLGKKGDDFGGKEDDLGGKGDAISSDPTEESPYEESWLDDPWDN
jgi:hypothetical protein